MAGSRLSPAHKLLFVFVITVFAPGSLLAVFGARALWKERRIAESELRARLDRGGQAVVRALSDELGKLHTLLDQPGHDEHLRARLVQAPPAAAKPLMERLRRLTAIQRRQAETSHQLRAGSDPMVPLDRAI
jgi:hypothetical protein